MTTDAEVAKIAGDDEFVYLPRIWRAFKRWLVAVTVALGASITLRLFGVSGWLCGWLSCSAYFIALSALEAHLQAQETQHGD